MARHTLHGDYSEIIGDSPQIFEVLQQIENFAATSMRILISGETGTGKGVVARALHQNSNRSGEMISLSCAAIPETLLESELFGHEKGAFTSAEARRIGRFERANNGTLFLDEIAEMPLSMQSKLLHAVEESDIERLGGEKSIPVDVRIVTATNKNLEQAVRDGKFREDLYYRLVVAKEIVDLAAEIYGFGKEDIEGYNAVIQDKAKEIENIKLLQETRPQIQAAIDSGDLSPEEGEAFIKDATGLSVTMHRRKNASTVNERTSPVENARRSGGTTSPEYVDLNTPDFPGD